MKKKNISIIAFSDLHKDPRVFRQIEWLSPHYNVTTFGFTPSGIDGVRHITLHQPKTPWHDPSKWTRKGKRFFHLIFKQFEKFYWSSHLHQQALISIKELEKAPDLVLANDIYTMPLALKAAQGTPVLLDLHEYAPKEWEDILKWRLLFQPYAEYLTQHYLPKAAASLTVCNGIAEEYERNFSVKPKVITNAPSFCNLNPSPSYDDKIRMIHHGGAAPSRQLEQMIYLMDHLDHRFELDFMLVPGDLTYIEKLKRLASKNPRIRFLPPIPMQQLSSFSNEYDVGLYFLPPTSFNSLHALPNKFFEFIQARLVVAIGPSPEMAYPIKKYQCGIIADDFNIKSLSVKLLELTKEKINVYKKNSHHAAFTLNAEINKDILLKMIELVF